MTFSKKKKRGREKERDLCMVNGLHTRESKHGVDSCCVCLVQSATWPLCRGELCLDTSVLAGTGGSACVTALRGDSRSGRVLFCHNALWGWGVRSGEPWPGCVKN